MGCICSKAASAKDSIVNAGKSLAGMEGSRIVLFGNPIKIFDAEKLQKGEDPKKSDFDFMSDDSKWKSTKCGCMVGQKAFVIYDDELWQVDLENKEYSKNATQLDKGKKYADTKAICHYDDKLYLFSDTVYKADVGLSMLSKLPSLPGSDAKATVNTEAFSCGNGIWGNTRCILAQKNIVWAVCDGKLYKLDLSEKDSSKNCKVVNDENWGSVESLFMYEKKLYATASKIWVIEVENEAAYPKAPYQTFDESRAYWSPSAMCIGDYAYLGGYNGLYQISMKPIASGLQREVKHWELEGRVLMNFI